MTIRMAVFKHPAMRVFNQSDNDVSGRDHVTSNRVDRQILVTTYNVYGRYIIRLIDTLPYTYTHIICYHYIGLQPLPRRYCIHINNVYKQCAHTPAIRQLDVYSLNLQTIFRNTSYIPLFQPHNIQQKGRQAVCLGEYHSTVSFAVRPCVMFKVY